MHQFNLEGTNIEYKTVARVNDRSSHVYLPKDWLGKNVAVVLLEELE